MTPPAAWLAVRAAAAVLMSVGALLFANATFAQTYPSRPVKLVVPFPGGGPLDFTARLLAEKLVDRL